MIEFFARAFGGSKTEKPKGAKRINLALQGGGALGAFTWGVLGSSSLLLGAVITLRVRISPRVIGLVMAFGAGVLISAVAFVLAFAAGAILTMLADTMMPEAYEEGGTLVGALTTLGFALAVWLQSLE